MGAPSVLPLVFADGAKLDDMLRRYKEGVVKGYTTNPTLMAKAGVPDYRAFAKTVLAEIKTLPISFEVFSDEFAEMERQALEIASWGPNVNVKIPISNTRNESSIPLIRRLLDRGLKLNVTAVFTEAQIRAVYEAAKLGDDIILSIFAGRIADTGVDPIPAMRGAVALFRDKAGTKVLWASPREVLNYYQAGECGCHIITMTDEQITKLKLRGKPLAEVSLDTVKMFRDDAVKAGFTL